MLHVQSSLYSWKSKQIFARYVSWAHNLFVKWMPAASFINSDELNYFRTWTDNTVHVKLLDVITHPWFKVNVNCHWSYCMDQKAYLYENHGCNYLSMLYSPSISLSLSGLWTAWTWGWNPMRIIFYYQAICAGNPPNTAQWTSNAMLPRLLCCSPIHIVLRSNILIELFSWQRAHSGQTNNNNKNNTTVALIWATTLTSFIEFSCNV